MLETNELGSDMCGVVERLRASKQASQAESYDDGRKAGEAWAKAAAEAVELGRLEEFRDYCESGPWDFEDWFKTDVMAPNDHAGWIADAVTEDADAADHLFGERRSDHDYLRGFVEGALSVWLAVKDQL